MGDYKFKVDKRKFRLEYGERDHWPRFYGILYFVSPSDFEYPVAVKNGHASLEARDLKELKRKARDGARTWSALVTAGGLVFQAFEKEEEDDED